MYALNEARATGVSNLIMEWLRRVPSIDNRHRRTRLSLVEKAGLRRAQLAINIEETCHLSTALSLHSSYLHTYE